jgi:hypothetical protein
MLEPILRLLNLQPQRQRCNKLEGFFKVEEHTFQNILGYSKFCIFVFFKFLQRWRCNSRS